MNTSVDPAKQWAVGMSQDDFARAFTKRNPSADVVPNVEKWLSYPESRSSTLIDPVNPELMDIYEGAKTKAPAKSDGTGVYSENGKWYAPCGYVSSARIGAISHSRKCKKCLSERV